MSNKFSSDFDINVPSHVSHVPTILRKCPTPVPTQLQQRNPPAVAAPTAVAEQKVTVLPASATVKVVPASATLKVVPASATVAAAEAPKKTYAQGPYSYDVHKAHGRRLLGFMSIHPYFVDVIFEC